MKKTKTIQLVLITAALASCNKPMIPTKSAAEPEYTPDPAYALNRSDSSCPMYPEGYYPYEYSNDYSNLYPSYYTGTYWPGWDYFQLVLQWQPPIHVYRHKGIVMRRPAYTHRGGFGKLGVTTTAS